MYFKHAIRVAACAMLLVLSAGLASAAKLEPSSDLLLPYFEVDLSGKGVTTLFAVGNALAKPVDAQLTVHTNWGIPVSSTTITLKGGEVATFNLRDWLIAGRAATRALAVPAAAHLKAAVAGKPSPKDGLYYGSEIEPNVAVGYVTLRVQGAERPDALWGDFFIVDPAGNNARGDNLVDIDPASGCGGGGLCRRHALRFLSGAGFDAGTEVVIWTGRQGRPSEYSDYEEVDRIGLDAAAFDQLGRSLEERALRLLPVEKKAVGELGLSQAFGWLDVTTEPDSWIGVSYSAEGRYSVALRAYCLGLDLEAGPGLRLKKLTNGEDADQAPGPSIPVGAPVLWEYVVTNTGDVALADVTVTDDHEDVTVSCPKDALQPGESMTCTARGTAVACQYRNLGTATATTPSGVPISAEDPSHYLGTLDAAIGIEKATNGQDADQAPGPSIPVGSPVQWTYVVTNSGAVALTQVRVTDDKGVAVTCPKTSLQPGESMTCTGHGTAVAGQYANVGTATGTPPCGPAVADSDPSHYVGASPGLDIEKLTNGHDADVAPGPSIPVGSPVLWEYLVTNTGQVALSQIAVTDDKGVAVSCPKTSLQPGESMTCTGHGTAVAGQYANVGTATGTPPSGAVVSDSDPSHYVGEVPRGGQGCTPGYWKNHTDSWPPTGYQPSQRVDGVFGQASRYPALGSASLHEALSFNGGSSIEGAAGNLLRASVAALLNTAHSGVSYPWATAAVIADVDAALASGDRDTMLGLASALDRDNNLGCPLN